MDSSQVNGGDDLFRDFCFFLLTGATQVVPLLVQGPLCHACVHVGYNEEGAEQVV